MAPTSRGSSEGMRRETAPERRPRPRVWDCSASPAGSGTPGRSRDEAVAHLLDGLDAAGPDLLTELGDVVVDGAGGGDVLRLVPPHLVQQPLAAHDLAAVPEEESQHLVLLEREREGDVAPPDLVAGEIHRQVPH